MLSRELTQLGRPEALGPLLGRHLLRKLLGCALLLQRLLGHRQLEGLRRLPVGDGGRPQLDGRVAQLAPPAGQLLLQAGVHLEQPPPRRVVLVVGALLGHHPPRLARSLPVERLAEGGERCVDGREAGVGLAGEEPAEPRRRAAQPGHVRLHSLHGGVEGGEAGQRLEELEQPRLGHVRVVRRRVGCLVDGEGVHPRQQPLEVGKLVQRLA
mmetsp:Transcript_38636/g.123974  ORF Transcript_38636/g.123974 Transcript_38636/m.123974 type:complete len:211 (-) Transcript_38636:505-1137(-)